MVARNQKRNGASAGVREEAVGLLPLFAGAERALRALTEFVT